MTQLEKARKLADLQTKLQMLEDEYRAVEATPVTTPHKVWEPEDNEIYYSGFHKGAEQFFPTQLYDRNHRNLGFAHPTKESAERHHSFLVMLHDLHKFAVEHNEEWKTQAGQYQHFYIALDRVSGLAVSNFLGCQYSVLPHFKVRELAQKAIDTFGDRLKILFEYYNS